MVSIVKAWRQWRSDKVSRALKSAVGSQRYLLLIERFLHLPDDAATNYRPTVGMGIKINTNFATASHLLRALEEACYVMQVNDYLPTGFYRQCNDQTMTLDNWLVDDNNHPIHPEILHGVYREKFLGGLNHLVSLERSDIEYYRYYSRQIEKLLQESIEWLRVLDLLAEG